MDSIYTHYNGAQWGQILQNIDKQSQVDEMHGSLVATEGSLQVKLVHPDTHQEVLIPLTDIIAISREILDKTEDAKKKEIVTKLDKFHNHVRQIVSNQDLRSKLNFEILNFYDDVNEIKDSLK